MIETKNHFNKDLHTNGFVIEFSMPSDEKCIENPEIIDIDVQALSLQSKIHLQHFLRPESKHRSVLIILNQEIVIGDIFLKLWNNFGIKICADGGANRLYDFFVKNEDLRSGLIPDYIVGDLDSLKDTVKDYYIRKGVKIISQSTQYSTDFSKGLHLATLYFFSKRFHDLMIDPNIIQNHGIESRNGIHDMYHEVHKKWSRKLDSIDSIDVLALGGIGGRFDQTIHSITQLYLIKQTDPYFNLYYLTETDLIFLIPAKGSLIEYSQDFKNRCLGNCGLLPIGAPNEIYETRGLKWDVRNWKTSVKSGQVSSSNRLVGRDKCYIHVKDHLIMNVEINLDNIGQYI